MIVWEQHACISREIRFACLTLVKPSPKSNSNHLVIEEAYRQIFRPHDISPSGLASALRGKRGMLVKNSASLGLLARAAAIPQGAKAAKLAPLTMLADAADSLDMPKVVGLSLRVLATLPVPASRALSILPPSTTTEALRRTAPLHAYGNPLLHRLQHER